MRVSIAVIAGAVLAGCSGGPQSVASDYSGKAGVMVEAEQNKWMVVDNPDKGRMLVERDIFNAATHSRAALPRITYERVAGVYLAKTGRTCRISSGAQVTEQAWELTYACEPTPPAGSNMPRIK